MDMRVETRDGDVIIAPTDTRIDAAVAIAFKERMREATRDVGARVVLDLRAVEFVDSSGLGAIVASMKQLRPDQKLELADLQPTVAKVFRLTRMDSVFRIHGNADAAFSNPAE